MGKLIELVNAAGSRWNFIQMTGCSGAALWNILDGKNTDQDEIDRLVALGETVIQVK